MTTPQPDLSPLTASVRGFFAVILLALVAFHVIAWAATQEQQRTDARYCADVHRGKMADYRQVYNQLCKRGRLQ